MTDPKPLPSSRQIGDKAYFQPNLRLIDGRTQHADPALAAPCEIAAVKFAAGKVRYDIDVVYVETYEGKDTTVRIPLHDVDSIMICDGGDE